jgi:phosphoribosylglycinamide formyltransferase-1
MRITTSDSPLHVVVLVSGKGSNLQALIDAINAGRITADIRAVISNNPDAYGLIRAQQAGIPTEVVDHREFPDRASYDRALQACIDHYQPELVVLAGFMRILTDDFVNHYLGRMINIHPSLLPKYQGLNTHQRALDAGDTVHGVSVHFVTPELDGGPVILQAGVPVHAGDTAKTLARRVLEREHVIYPLVVRWFADGRLQLEGDQVLLDSQPMRAEQKRLD